MCLEHSERNDTYYDKNVTGANISQRPGFIRLLRHCEENRIDLILTKSISRFSRNSKDLLEVVNRLTELGISVRFEKENIDTKNNKHKFFLTAMAAIAQEEIRTTSENVHWGYKKRIRDGNPLFRYHQYGYDVTKDKDKYTVTVNEEQAAVVRKIFELFNSGMREYEIAKLLTDNGVDTDSKTKVWSSSKIGYFLRQRRFLGEKLTNQFISDFIRNVDFMHEVERDQYFIENSHPPIVSNEVFEKAQEILSQRKDKNYKEASVPHPLTKRIWCGFCNAKYHRNSTKKQIIWMCSTKHKQKGMCPSKRIKDEEIVSMMKEAINQRYGINQLKALKVMTSELDWLNKNDNYEFHQLSLLSQLEIAREKEKRSVTDKEIRKAKEIRKEIEQRTINYEILATLLEEDLKYRKQAIIKLNQMNSLDQFLKEADIDLMRAWIIEITIFSKKDYKVRWIDDTYSTFGDYEGRENISSLEINQEEITHLNDLIGSEVEDTSKDKKLIIQLEKGDSMEAVQEIIKIGRSTPIISRIKNAYKEAELIEEPKIRVAAYARVSTSNPVQLGSLEAQMAYYTYFILRNPKYEIVRVYADEGISGTSTSKRDGFQQMIEDCKKGKIDRIVTKSISRFARNTVDCLEHVRLLETLGISVLFEKEGIDTSEKDSEVLLTVYSALAQEESRSLGESVAWSKRKKAQRGYANPSIPAFGYVYDENKNWVINPYESKVIKRIFEDYVKGQSMLQIAKDLSEDGVKTPRGNKKWGQTTLRKILLNSAYKGDLLYQKTYTLDTIESKRINNNGDLPMYLIENHHPAIVSKKIWEKAQQQMLENTRNKEREKVRNHNRQEFFQVFSCSECGGVVIHIGNYASKNKKDYWRCVNAVKKTHTPCTSGGFREESLEHTFMTMLQEMKKTDKLEYQIKQATECLKLTDKEKQHKKRLEVELQQLYKALYDIVDEGKQIGEDTEAIKELTDEVMKLHEQINEWDERKEKAQYILSELKWLSRELNTIEEFDPSKERISFKGEIFKRIVERGIVYPDGKVIYHLKLGITWTTSGNKEQLWRLPIKSI